MRKMFVLRGAPGTGKSRWIYENKLGGVSVGLDDVRRLMCTSVPVLEWDLSYSTNKETNKRIVDVFESVLVSRFQMGATVFLDNTNPDVKSFKRWASLARKYGYEVEVINIQEELCNDVEVAVENNSRRTFVSRVDEGALRRIFDRVEAGNDEVSRLFNTVSTKDVLSGERTLAPCLNYVLGKDVDRIVVVGDIQSCFDELSRLVREYDSGDDRTMFVFTGDLFDRGPDAAGVYHLVDRLIREGRALVIEGNHDEHMRMIASGISKPADWSRAKTDVSYRQIMDSGVSRKELREFCQNFVPCATMSVHSQEGDSKFFMLSHGGVFNLSPYISGCSFVKRKGRKVLVRNLMYECDYGFVHGVSNRDRTYMGGSTYTHENIDTIGFENRECNEDYFADNPIITVHGHRNGGLNEELDPRIDRGAPDHPGDHYVLEGRVEHGYGLRALVIEADSVSDSVSVKPVFSFNDRVVEESL